MNFNSATCYNLLKEQFGALPDFLTSDLSKSQAAKVWLLNSFLKKWEPENSTHLDQVAKRDFVTSNAICRDYVLIDGTSYDREILEDAKHQLELVFEGVDQESVLTLHACMGLGRTGPGSSVGTKHTDFFNKMFNSTLTTTDMGLYEFYVRNLSPTWLESELIRLKQHGVGVVEGSNLSTVLKNSETNRTICTEPSLNMFFQLGAGAVIEGLLKKYHNIDISTQPLINRLLTRIGSITGDFATIDLKAASDRISIALLKYLLPRQVFMLLMQIRSAKTKMDDEYIELEMMSSMGNGFTFPLQTLIFATLVRATYNSLGYKPNCRKNNRNYAVFGDDIVCLNETYEDVVRVLHSCGFTVNLTKSYHTGAFRESCGCDYFRGTDIRGVYLKKVKNEQDVYSVFNRLARWSLKHNIDVSACLLYLKGLVKFRPVPYDESDNSGFKCPKSHLTAPKYNADGALKYRAFVARSQDRVLGPAYLVWNPTAILLAHVGGYMTTSKDVVIDSPAEEHVRKMGVKDRGHHFSVRSNAETEWKVVKKTTQSWDWIPHPGFTIRDCEALWQWLSYEENKKPIEISTPISPLEMEWDLSYFYTIPEADGLPNNHSRLYN